MILAIATINDFTGCSVNSYGILNLLKLQIIENAKWIRNKAVLLTHFSSRYHIEVFI